MCIHCNVSSIKLREINRQNPYILPNARYRGAFQQDTDAECNSELLRPLLMLNKDDMISVLLARKHQ